MSDSTIKNPVSLGNSSSKRNLLDTFPVKKTMNIIEVSCFVHSPAPWSLDESSSCPCRCLLACLAVSFSRVVCLFCVLALLCVCVRAGVCVCFGLHCVCFYEDRRCAEVFVWMCVFLLACRSSTPAKKKEKKTRYKLCTHHILVASVVLVVVLEIMADEGGEEQPEEEVASLVCVRLNVNDNDCVYVKSSWRKTSFSIIVLNNQSGEAWSCDGA